MTEEVATIETPTVKKRKLTTKKKAVKTKKNKAVKSKKKKRVMPKGRPMLYHDTTMVRMAKGTLKRVHSALKADESQGSFMRTAIDRELAKRTR